MYIVNKKVTMPDGAVWYLMQRGYVAWILREARAELLHLAKMENAT